MTLRRRLEHLERTQEGQGAYKPPVSLTLYFKELENVRRQEAELEPIPLTPEEEAEARETSRWFLEEYIPHLREKEVHEEHLAIVDQLEEHARAKAKRKEQSWLDAT